ncbi:MAG: class I SAM-dependent methyltransferase [Caldilineaceae bacterium]
MSNLQTDSQEIPVASENSQGQYGSNTLHLDEHYLLAKQEYDQSLRDVGFKDGWKVLDAGCGTGVFTWQLSVFVGNTGEVTAYDHAPETIETIEMQKGYDPSFVNVKAQLGSITSLPFPDNSFDAIWCANVTQYLTDQEMDQMMAEFKRVVREDGLVAIKEYDTALTQIHPVDMVLMWRLGEALIESGHVNTVGVLRSPIMSRWLRKQDMEILQRRTYIVERTAPMEPFALDYAIGTLQALGGLAQVLNLSDEDKRAWQTIADSAAEIMSDPDANYREMFTLTVGKVHK